MSERTSPPIRRRWPKVLGISLVLLVLVAVIAFQIVARVVKDEIVAALGPDAELRELKIGLTHVQIIGLRLPAPRGEGKAAWPADDFLRAERITITPVLSSLLSDRIVINDIHIEGAYLSLLREAGGRLRLLPPLTENTTATIRRTAPARFAALRHSDRANTKPCATAPAGMKLDIQHIEMVNGRVDFFDASIRKTPLRIALENLDFRLDYLRLPEQTGESRLKLAGILKGRTQDGKISIEGKIEFANKTSDLQSRLQGVDITVLQAYLVKTSDTNIQRGLLDMEVHSVVNNGRLHAPGALTINHLELGNNGNAFMGIPQTLVVAILQGGKSTPKVRFTLAGDLNNPRFSLNESIAREIGMGLARALGINPSSSARVLGNPG
jgi:uncharacterized protein involved in outer membrane biogenesis